MCGRYTAAIKLKDAANELKAVPTVKDYPPRYNLAPTEDAPIAIEREERRVGLARFGLVPRESEGPKAIGARYINLRAEGLLKQRKFADAGAHRRCLVIADGFYEWKPEGARKQAWYFQKKGGGLLTFAGVWDTWGTSEARVASFAILTTAPSELVSPIHDRMPMIVPPELRDLWLSPLEHDAAKAIAAIRAATPVELEAWKVGPHVGKVSNDDSSLIENIEATGSRHGT